MEINKALSDYSFQSALIFVILGCGVPIKENDYYLGHTKSFYLFAS